MTFNNLAISFLIKYNYTLFFILNSILKRNIIFENYYLTICNSVWIGQKQSTVANIYQILKKCLAINYTFFIEAGSAKTAPEQYISVYTGISILEFFQNNGFSALCIFDDLSKQAVSYRQLSLLLRRPPGREAFPADSFYLHSRLLERASKISEFFKSGGSISALPIVETQGGDFSSYISTNLVGITDGQIFLETELFYKGLRPATNYGLSVSRVGSAAQNKSLKKISSSLKLELALFREVESFQKFDSSDLDIRTKQLLTRGSRLIIVLTQKQYTPFNLNEQLFFIYLAISGYLDSFPLNKISLSLEYLFYNNLFINFTFYKKKFNTNKIIYYNSESSLLFFLINSFISNLILNKTSKINISLQLPNINILSNNIYYSNTNINFLNIYLNKYLKNYLSTINK